MIAPRVRRLMDRGVERLHILPRRNWKVAGTALALLVFGTVKEWGPISDFVKDPGDLFSEGLMLLVLCGWAFWLAGVAGEFFGTEIVSVERGDLVISRGIGRLRRTWRYVTRDIAWMVSDGPVTEEQARPVVHHIFHKPTSERCGSIMAGRRSSSPKPSTRKAARRSCDGFEPSRREAPATIGDGSFPIVAPGRPPQLVVLSPYFAAIRSG